MFYELWPGRVFFCFFFRSTHTETNVYNILQLWHIIKNIWLKMNITHRNTVCRRRCQCHLCSIMYDFIWLFPFLNPPNKSVDFWSITWIRTDYHLKQPLFSVKSYLERSSYSWAVKLQRSATELMPKHKLQRNQSKWNPA